MGAFNVALEVKDNTVGYSCITRGMNDVLESINNIEVEDLNFTDLFYTQNKSPNGGNDIFKKLDRVIYNTHISFFPLPLCPSSLSHF